MQSQFPDDTKMLHLTAVLWLAAHDGIQVSVSQQDCVDLGQALMWEGPYDPAGNVMQDLN